MEKRTAILLASAAAVTVGLLYAFRKQVGSAVNAAVDYALDINQNYHVKQLHPIVREKFTRFIAEVEKLGYKVVITSSYRSFAEQQALNRKDKRNAEAGNSEHNYGFAIDVNIQKGLTVWKKGTDKQAWINTGIPAIASRVGLRWGGSSYKSYYDPVHFSVPVDTKKLKQIAIAQQGSDLTIIKGNQIRIAA